MANAAGKPIFFSPGTLLRWSKDRLLVGKGKNFLAIPLPGNMCCRQERTHWRKLFVLPRSQSNQTAGSSLRSQVMAALQGIHRPLSMKILFQGVGYRASLYRNILVLRLGFSHKIFCTLPPSLQIQKIRRRPPVFLLSGPNYYSLRSCAFLLRSFKAVEPYKGKGVLLMDEYIQLKEGKKSKKS